ncbi:MAG: serine/threonine protein phosphatase [Alphaproteobacteria bacterium]|nr:MAG: serine/threonine protein phosphatase [Alphaproteobacteria bacterium]
MIYAVGDIHGELALLEKMLDEIRNDASDVGARDAEIVFVGDYVDRGPDSKGVIERLMKPVEGFVVTCLFGNHEQLFLDFLHEEDPDHSIMYLRKNAGGSETLMSYEVDMVKLERAVNHREPYAEFLKDIPTGHIDWMEQLPYSYETEDYYFVHAGILPGVRLNDQVPYDQIWIRNEFLEDPRDHGKLIVHGHTPVRGGEILHNRINVDAGACYFGTLQAVVLDGGGPRFLSVSA